MFHQTIKRFGLEGEIGDDADFARLREQFEYMVLKNMRDDGYVPLLEFGPFWSTSYNVEADLYEFVSSTYGTYVGKKKACLVEGISEEGIELMRPMLRIKSNQSSKL